MAEDRSVEVEKALSAILEYEKGKPEEYGEIIGRLEKLAKEAVGTKYAVRVGQEIERVRVGKKEAADRALATLKAAVESKVAAGQLAEAEQAAANYAGAYAAETTAARAELVQWVKSAAPRRKAGQ